MPCAFSARDRVARARPDRSATATSPAGLAVDGDEHRRLARLGQRARPAPPEPSASMPSRSQQLARCRPASARPSTVRGHAVAGDRLERRRPRRVRGRAPARPRRSPRQAGAPSRAPALATSRSSSSLRHAVGRHDVGQGGLPSVSVPVLSSTIASSPRDALQRRRVLDEDVVPRADARADRDRRRRRQAERVGAGDHHRQIAKVSAADEVRVGEERPGREGEQPAPTREDHQVRRRPGRRAAGRAPSSSAPAATSSTIWASAVSAPTLVAAEA